MCFNDVSLTLSFCLTHSLSRCSPSSDSELRSSRVKEFGATFAALADEEEKAFIASKPKLA